MTELSDPLLPGRSFAARTFSSLSPNGVRSSIVTFCSGVLGAGLLSLPYAMSTCGVAGGCLLLLAVGICYYLFYFELVVGCERANTFTFVGVMEVYFGKIGKRAVELTILLDTIGTIALMDTLLQNFGLLSLSELGLIQNSNSTDRAIFLLIVVLLVQLPLVVSEHIHSLRYASTASLFCVIYLAVVVVVQTPAYMAERTTPNVYFRWDVKALDSAGIIFFAFSNPQLIPLLYCELERRSPKRMEKVLFRSFFSLALLYLLVGVSGYLSYADRMPEIFTHRWSLDGGVDYPMLVGRTVYLLTITAQVPFSLYPARLALLQFFGGTKYNANATRYYAITLSVLLIPMGVAIFVPGVLVYFKVIGSIPPVLLGIVFPLLIGCASAEMSAYRVLLVSLALCCCVFAAASFSTLFLSA